jgi:NitT/TauT family transport system ATP-binding protein
METLDQSSDSSPKILVRNLRKVFYPRVQDPLLALDDITFDVRDGEFCCIVGPSGCGKSTILRILAGLVKPSSGEVTIADNGEGKMLSAMVFQESSIFPWMTVWKNVAYGLQVRGESTATIREQTDYFVNVAGLAKFKNSFPHQLSGGMKQRVSVARAFAADPEVLLMDEPFGSLDEQNKYILQEKLLSIWLENQKTVVFITHSIDEAIKLGDVILVMTAQPGNIKEMLRVNIPREDRNVEDLRSHPEFQKLFQQIWHALRQEISSRQESDESGPHPGQQRP